MVTVQMPSMIAVATKPTPSQASGAQPVPR